MCSLKFKSWKLSTGNHSKSEIVSVWHMILTSTSYFSDFTDKRLWRTETYFSNIHKLEICEIRHNWNSTTYIGRTQHTLRLDLTIFLPNLLFLRIRDSCTFWTFYYFFTIQHDFKIFLNNNNFLDLSIIWKLSVLIWLLSLPFKSIYRQCDRARIS